MTKKFVICGKKLQPKTSLNSVETSSSKKFVQRKLHSSNDSSITFCPEDR